MEGGGGLDLDSNFNLKMLRLGGLLDVGLEGRGRDGMLKLKADEFLTCRYRSSRRSVDVREERGSRGFVEERRSASRVRY
jgi:hypothetical protein